MVEFTREFQCFFVRLPFKLYFRLRPATKLIKTASGAPRPKSAPRGSKSTTFAQGKFQVSNPQKMVANPIEEPSVSPFQSEVGGGNGAERSPPPGIQAQRPSPSHRTHRTHDTTDQWRDGFLWLGRKQAVIPAHLPLHEMTPRVVRVLSFVLSKELQRFFEDMFESTYKNKVLVNCRSFEQGITMVSFTTRCRMLESRYKNKGLVNYG